MRLFTILFMLSISLLSYQLDLKKGWNLVGFSQEISSQDIAKIDLITKTYTYRNGEWIANGDIKQANGVWVYSAKDGVVELADSSQELSKDISQIELESGWNLVSLPINSAVSPDIFKDQKSVWKYRDGQWSKYRKDDLFSNYPTIDVIGAGEGFWVYSETSETIDILDRSSKLKNFSSDEAMIDYLTSMVRFNKNYQGGAIYPYLRGGIYLEEAVDMAVPTDNATAIADDTSSEKISDATTTNIQEVGVDEADIVKHDGEKIFYLGSSWNENRIYVTTFQHILNNNFEPVTYIETESKPDELYLINNRLIAIYPHNRYFWGYWCDADYSVWSSKSHIDIYDVSDRNSISKIDSFEFDGNIVDSRVTNGKLYLISRYMPYIEVEYPKVYVECKDDNYCWYSKDEVGYFDYNWSNPIEKEFHITPAMNNQSLISSSTLYAPSKIDQSPFITSIVSFEIDDFSKHEAISVVGGSETIYASTDAIYSVSSSYPLYYDWHNWEDRVAIYKFGIDDNLSYNGMGFVDGRVLNQFSLSEYKDTLRVATTKGRNWWIEGDTTDNMVFSLVEVNGTLQKVGEVRGLGKENETIRGVRFLGDKGYIVTFLQTDPLYIIDMSDPKNLKIGENPLEINGFSTYFHPVNEELLLSLGVDADDDGRTTGYQLQLFNVKDFNNPSLVDKVVLEGSTRWSLYSEAIYDHKAFTYRASDNLFGLPLREYIQEEMSEEDKVKYLEENWIAIDEMNLSEYGIESKFDEEELSQDGDYKLYANISSLESGYLRTSAISSIYYPNYRYENSFRIYQVDTNSSKIEFKRDILGGGLESYNYQRGVIFSTGEDDNLIDWGLYISGGNLYLSEIE